jgi:hypothetical protein
LDNSSNFLKKCDKILSNRILEKLKKLHNSLQDVNYHTQGRILTSIINLLKKNDKIEAEKKAEEARIQKEKEEAAERERIKVENERLKKEAEEKEKALEVERKKQAEILAKQKAGL